MKQMHKQKQRAITGLTSVLIVVVIISLFSLLRRILKLETFDAVSVIISTIESVGLIVSLIIAIKQLVGSKEIARATFITELNKSFVENEDYLTIYNLLQNCYDGDCKCENPCGERINMEKRCGIKIPKGQISNYLTFFETIYLLKNRGVISYDVIDDLFAYRFFLAVHSKLVQQSKIAPQPQNFVNIFRLECEWLGWRYAHGKDHDPGCGSVYVTLPLRNLVDNDTYVKMTEGCQTFKEVKVKEK